MTFRAIATLTMTAVVLAGCAAPNDPNQRAKNGALIGGAIGAAIGQNHDGLDNAIVGGVVGAAIGGAIGNALDRQAADLRQSLDNDQVRIVNTGSSLVVTMPQDILFATDSAFVRDGLRGDLAVLADNLQDYPDTTVQVIGHTDNTGSAAYNEDLSARRAGAVSNILVSNGVNPSRVRSFGRGEDAPVATNLTPEGRAQNRRVEIIIRPNAV